MAVYENRLVYLGVFGFVFVSKRQCVVESGAGEGGTEKRGGVFDHYFGLDVWYCADWTHDASAIEQLDGVAKFFAGSEPKTEKYIECFQKKASVLVTQSEALVNTLPMEFNQPAVRARLKVINTKLKSLDLFIHLNQTPAAKVVKLIGEINTEIEYLQLQFEEIVQRSLIPREPGEPDFVKMKDTTRAIPNTPIIP